MIHWSRLPEGIPFFVPAAFRLKLITFPGYLVHSWTVADARLLNNFIYSLHKQTWAVPVRGICEGCYFFLAFVSRGYFGRETYAVSTSFAFETYKACGSQKQSWKRACSESWQIIVQWPGGNDSCSSFIMQILRCLQKCGKLKMMAVVRTSLQKVVVLLHRLQRMAVSSPRYQKLCKVRNISPKSWECLMLTLLSFWDKKKRK